MVFPIITFVVAISIAVIAAWFSIAGLMAIFAAAAIPVAIMAGALEVGKLVSASWVYRNWRRAPFLLKSYLTIATIVLMFITSMGIFGFLSKAHLEHAAASSENIAKIERIENNILRLEDTVLRSENKAKALDSEASDDTSDIQSQIDAEQQRMDSAYSRIQPAIDELKARIQVEQSGSSSYHDQIAMVDSTLADLQRYVANDDIKKLQALVGITADGVYGPNTAKAVDEYRKSQIAEKDRLLALVKESSNSVVVDEAREEINRLRAGAEREVANSQATIDRLRTQLNTASAIDNTAKIDELNLKIRNAESEIEVMLDEKFELESSVRALEAEVGPIKYIAEVVYGNTERDNIDDAVRWLIIIFIVVFDPLAVLLLIAANFSFQHRNDDDRQEEIFEVFSKKKAKKSLDKTTSMSDNSTVVEEPKPVKSAEEIQRDENTEKFKKSGWLDLN